MKIHTVRAYWGARTVPPAAAAGLAWLILVPGYGFGPAPGLLLSLLAGAAALLDASAVEREFRTSRELAHSDATAGEVSRLIGRLFLKATLAETAFLCFFELAYGLRGAPPVPALAAGAAGALFVLLLFSLQSESVHIDGTEVIPFREAKDRAAAAGGVLAERFPFVPGIWLAVEYLKYGILIIGAARTGKTLLLRCFLKWALSGRVHGVLGLWLYWKVRKVRAFIYDGKGDLLSAVMGMSPAAPVWSMNPFDDFKASLPGRLFRCVRWAWGKDINHPKIAKTAARMIVSIDAQRASDPFWAKAATMIVSGVFIALDYICRMRGTPGAWGLIEFVLCFRSEEDLVRILESCPYTKNRVKYLRGKTKSGEDICKTLMNDVLAFEEIAAAWQDTPYEISLREWAKSDGIILCPVDESAREPLDVLYRLMFHCMSMYLLRPRQKERGQTFVVVDEAREASGELKGLNSLLVRGFGLGTVTVVTFQSIQGFASAIGHEGHGKVSEIIGQLRHRVITQTQESKTCEQLSAELGRRELWETTETAPGAEDRGERRERKQKDAVMAASFGNLRAADEKTGMSAYVASPCIGGVTVLDLSGRELRAAVPPEDKDIPCLVEADEDAMPRYLEPWTTQQRQAFGLPPEEEDPPAAVASQPNPNAGGGGGVVLEFVPHRPDKKGRAANQ